MLAMTSVIVDYTFNNVFSTFYILQAPPKRRETHGNKRANSGKITSFRGSPHWRPCSKETPYPAARNFVTNTRALGAAHGEDFVILACNVLIQITSVTDRRTDTQAMAKTRKAFCYRA